MDCPDLETLADALDLGPGDPEHLDALRHVRGCQSCEAGANALRDVALVLGQAEAWGQRRDRGCLSAGEMLQVMNGEESGRERHLLGCEPCQVELKAMRAAEREPEGVSAGLKDRLKLLSPQNASTEELRPHIRRRHGGASRTRARTSSRRSGSPQASSRRVRRSGTLRRQSLRAPKPGVPQPVWAWGVLAAAAALLVGLAVALSPAPRDSIARGPATDDDPAPTRVSDVHGRPPNTPPEATPAPDVEPSYPLPPEPRDDDWARAGIDPDEGTDTPIPPSVADSGADGVDGSSGTTGVRPKVAARDSAATDSDHEGANPSEAERVVGDDGGRLELAMARLNGGLELQRDGQVRRLKRRGAAVSLKPGDIIRAKSGGFLSLEGGAYDLCLDKDTEVLVRGALAGPILDLRRGRVLAEVATLPADKQFRVLTDQGEFSVLGTVFAVEASQRASRLLVAEGTVSASNGLGHVKVPAGMQAQLDGTAPAAPVRYRDGDLAWARAWAPRRAVLYGVSFDDNKLGGFKGLLEPTLNAKGAGKALVLPLLKGNRYWGLCAQVPKQRLRSFRATQDGFLAFSLYSKEPQQVLLQCFNDSQGKEFKRGFVHPGGDLWKTFTVPLMDLNTYFDPGKNPVRAGDLFVDLEIYAALPGSTATLLLDDVTIYRKAYR